MQRLNLLNIVCLLALLNGCSGSPGDTPQLGEVSGTVTLDGEPLVLATVTFRPIDGGRDSTGETDGDGNYTLVYSTSSTGAKIGQHKVLVEKSMVGQDDSLDLNTKSLPEKYNSQSELTASVAAGENTLNFELKSE